MQGSASDHGTDEALCIIELDEVRRHIPSDSQWLHAHIDNLTGDGRVRRRLGSVSGGGRFRIDVTAKYLAGVVCDIAATSIDDAAPNSRR